MACSTDKEKNVNNSYSDIWWFLEKFFSNLFQAHNLEFYWKYYNSDNINKIQTIESKMLREKDTVSGKLCFSFEDKI